MLQLDLTLDAKGLPANALEVVRHVRPEWDKQEIRFNVFTQGITNKLVGCYLPSNPDDMVLVRVYGPRTEILINRQAEISNIQILHRSGVAPALYASFKNGICYEFVPGVTLDAVTCRDADVFPLVADAMARLHHVLPAEHGAEPKTAFIWSRLRTMVEAAPETFPDPDQQERYVSLIPSRAALLAEVQLLEERLSSVAGRVVLCHNDLLLGNVVYDADQRRVTFIDYEYCNYNYLVYDIANHFCEFAGIDEVDYSLYPDREFQLRWLRSYLYASWSYTSGPVPTRTDAASPALPSVSDAQVERLYVLVNKFALVAHLFWGIWALVQARYSFVTFDYLGYGHIRLTEYFSRKESFLSLPLPE